MADYDIDAAKRDYKKSFHKKCSNHLHIALSAIKKAVSRGNNKVTIDFSCDIAIEVWSSLEDMGYAVNKYHDSGTNNYRLTISGWEV